MSLSLRIFLWFWVSVLLVAAVTFAWTRSDFWSPTPLTEEQFKFMNKQVEKLDGAWRKHLKRDEPNFNWLDRKNGKTGWNGWWLYDPQSKRFVNKRVPRGILSERKELLSYAEPLLFTAGPHWVIGPIDVTLTGEKEFVFFVGLTHSMTRNLHWQQLIKGTPLLLAGIVLVLVLLSYLVARQITRPLESIRNTAEQIASGDFKAEVEPKLLNRKDEIGSLSRTASQMGQTIDLALEAHKRLLSDVSHELRSPLTRLSLANTLLTKRLGEQPESHRIEREVEELNGMIEQLLSLSRMQLTPEQERQPVAILAVLQRCLSDAEFSYPNIELRLNNRLEDTEEAWAKGSGELLTRAVQNVLNNAARYCRKQIRIDLKELPTSWLICIEDDGEGVPEAELGKLFVPFYRPEFARQRDKGGTGLGLAIVEQAIQFHGGEVKAERSELGGLAIQMTLPKAKPEVA